MGMKAPKVKDTAAGKLQADIAEEGMDRYRDIFEPIERSLIKETTAFETKQGTLDRTKAAYGHKISEGASGLMEGPLGSGTAARLGDYQTEALGGEGVGLSDANSQLEAGNKEDILGLVKHGRGEADVARRGIDAAATLATQRAIDNAKLAAERASARGEAIGNLAGSVGGAISQGGWDMGGSVSPHGEHQSWNTDASNSGGWGLTSTAPYEDYTAGGGRPL